LAKRERDKENNIIILKVLTYFKSNITKKKYISFTFLPFFISFKHVNLFFILCVHFTKAKSKRRRRKTIEIENLDQTRFGFELIQINNSFYFN
jgi:uncharacterized membrane protein